MNTKFVSIDIETGGLEPKIHPITEVGLVFEHDGVQEVEFSLPFDPSVCDPKALEIQRYGEREYAPQWSHAEAAHYLWNVTSEAYIIGKNPWFDTSFIEVFLRDWGFQKQWHHRLVDVGALAWGYTNGCRTMTMAAPVAEPPNSATVGNLLGYPLEEVDRHAALYDARWAWDIFREVVPA